MSTDLELSADQAFEQLLHQLFDAPISLRRTRQSTREIITAHRGREVLLDSPELHEYKGIPISIRKGDTHRTYYSGEILTTDKSTFGFRLSEDPNKAVENVPYGSIRGIIVLLREDNQITGARVYTNP